MATDRTAARKRARPAPVEPQAPDLDVLEDACCPIKAQRLSDARPVFWNLKSEAAMRFDVRIGDLPRAPYGTCAPPCSKV